MLVAGAWVRSQGSSTWDLVNIRTTGMTACLQIGCLYKVGPSRLEVRS